MANVPIVGLVLKWAREYRGLSLDEAATRTRLPAGELRAFEEELAQPSLTKFEQIASAYRLPAATLFRRTPPTEPKEPADFRTFGNAPREESFDFKVAQSNVRTLQATMKLLRVEDEEFQTANLRHYDFDANPHEQGEIERRKIGVSVETQLHWRSEEAFRRWRAIIEQLGIAVYLQNFSTNDCCGWSMAEENAPPAIIIAKEKQNDNARTFTLIHEYAHLLIRRPGISDLNSNNPTEAFCNKFAGAFLMPEESLRELLPDWPGEPQKWDTEVICDVAARLKVSAQSLAIRLEHLSKAERGFNRVFDVGKPKERKNSGKPPRVDHAVVRLSEIGARFTQSVIGALDREVIDSVHASEALGLSLPNLNKARRYLERYQTLASAELNSRHI